MKYSFIAPVAATLTLLGAPASAMTDTLANLLAGASLTEGDIVLDNFSLPINDGKLINPSQVGVSLGVTGSNVSVAFAFDPVHAISSASNGGFDFFEFDMFFDLMVQAPSFRQALSVALGDPIGASVTGSGGVNYAGVEVSADDPENPDTRVIQRGLDTDGDYATDNDHSFSAGLSSFTFNWDSQGEAEGPSRHCQPVPGRVHFRDGQRVC